MKNESCINLRILFFCLFLSLIVSSLFGSETAEESIRQDITMHKANSRKDPYTLMYNIKVTEAGRISVHIRKPEGSFHLDDKTPLFRIIIGDERCYNPQKMTFNRKYIKKAGLFVHERGLLEYNVDNLELGASNGNYIIFISNYYYKRPYQAHLNIRYPVKKTAENKPDSPNLILKPVEVKVILDDNIQ